MSLNEKEYRITNRIEPHAFIGPDVKMGEHNYVGIGTIIQGKVTIGNFNNIAPYTVIGAPPEHTVSNLHWDEIDGDIIIGNRNIIREFITIHHPHSAKTVIGDDNFLMCHSHVGHDAILENKITLSPYAKIGGYAQVQHHSYVGMMSTLHQNTTFGAYSMAGMGAVVVKDVPPFWTVIGNPAKFLGINARGMLRNGFTQEDVVIAKQYDRATCPFSHLRAAYDTFERVRNKDRKVLLRT